MTSEMQRTNNFANALRILKSLKHDNIEGLSDIESFKESPYKYYICCNDADLELIKTAMRNKAQQ